MRTCESLLPSLLPHARLVIVPGAGHMGPLTHAAEVNALIAPHIAERVARRLPRAAA